jgi:hypothetical protein
MDKLHASKTETEISGEITTPADNETIKLAKELLTKWKSPLKE